jgi:hypothetical protein
MDQRSVCLLLAKKGLWALDIHDELVAGLGGEPRMLDNHQISPAASLSRDFFPTARPTPDHHSRRANS